MTDHASAALDAAPGATVAPAGDPSAAPPPIRPIRLAAPNLLRRAARSAGPAEQAAWADHRARCDRAKLELAKFGRNSARDPARPKGEALALGGSEDMKHLAASVSHRLRSAKRARKSKRAERTSSIDRIRALAASIDPTAPSGEEVRVRGVPKDDGGVRPIVSFSDRDHARQTHARLILEANIASVDISDRDPYAALDTVALGAEAGFTHAVALDISNAYSTLRAASLSKISALSPEMVSTTIAAPRPDDPRVRRLCPPRMYGAVHAKLYPRSYRGLAQGSAAAPAASRALLSAWVTAARFDPVTPIVMLADDAVLLARSRAEAEELRDRLTAHKGACVKFGKLDFGRLEVVDLRDGLDFLGARLRLRGGEVLVGPSAEGLERFAARAADRSVSTEAQRKLARYVWAWSAQRSYWPGAGGFAQSVYGRTMVGAQMLPDDDLPDFFRRMAEQVRRERPAETPFRPHWSRAAKAAFLMREGRIPTPNLIGLTSFATRRTTP